VSQRLFLIGFVLLFLGIQLRMVKSFELNERASQVVSAKFAKTPATTTNYVSYDAYDDLLNPRSQTVAPAIQSITPPRWLGWSLISVGSVLILTNPCFRK
jgi:hypothetical protein